MGVSKRITVLFALAGLMALSGALPAQESYKYVIYLNDKAGSSGSLDHPDGFLSAEALERRYRQDIPVTISDLPVPQPYLDSLQARGLEILGNSRWLNAALVKAPEPPDLFSVDGLSFVKRVQWVARSFADGRSTAATESVQLRDNLVWAEPQTADYGHATPQIDMLNGRFLHENGYRGRGITIAVLDAGFIQAGELEAFRDLNVSGRLRGAFDAVDGDASVFEASGHGTTVLSVMAASLPGTYIGTAPEADYLLVRTEDVATEQLVEEFNYVLGLEYADQMGADVVNTSLGYTRFNHPEMDFGPEDLNGDRLIASVGADYAASKGMIVVNSAGNEGGSAWTYISRPADGDSVLAVGAVNTYGERTTFSGEGWPESGNIKPNLMAPGERVAVVNTEGQIGFSNGTSFSAPILSGLAACLWQAFPEKTNMEIIRALEQSATRYRDPDLLYGYGIPDLQAAYGLLFHERYEGPVAGQEIRIFPNPFRSDITLLLPETIGPDMVITMVSDIGQELFRTRVDTGSRKAVNLYFNGVEGLQKGLYFLKVKTGGEVSVFKLIKI